MDDKDERSADDLLIREGRPDTKGWGLGRLFSYFSLC